VATDTEPVAVAVDVAPEWGFEGVRARLLDGLTRTR